VPWTGVTAQEAKNNCRSLGANYDLISNAEWMALARDIESLASNWTGPASRGTIIGVGDGSLYRGHSNSAPNNSLTALANNATGCGGGECYGSTPASWAKDQKRQLNLSTGYQIWDFAGNVAEIVDWSLNLSPTATAYSPSPATPAGGLEEYVNGPTSTFTVLPVNTYKPNSLGCNSTLGCGMYLGGGALEAHRGGRWFDATVAGVYTLEMTYFAPSADIGFRCVWRP
jgi:hypothetical protein